jgi:putative transposase
LIYHVLNRAVGRMKMFRKDADYDAFARVIAQAHALHPIRILSYCVMPSHWHFVVRPERDGELSAFFRWLAHTHAMRWRVSHGTVGYGHLYQGRFKSFAVQRDGHFLTLCRYVERNALVAGLVRRAQDWRHGSLWSRDRAGDPLGALLSPWPVERPADWIDRVNRPLTPKEMERVRASVDRGRPLGDDDWTRQTVTRLGLGHTVRNEGRPRKTRDEKPGRS